MTVNPVRNTLSHISLFMAIGACFTFALAGEDRISPISIDAHASVGPLTPIGKEALTSNSPIPMAGGRVIYTSPDDSVHVGVWESAPATLKLNMQAAEFVHVVEGKTIIRDAAGKIWTYKAGDSFLLPSGFKGTAEIVGHFKKEFVDIKVSIHQ